MDGEILRRKDLSLIWFIGAFALTIFLFKLSSLLAQIGLYFQWSSLFEEQSNSYNLWLSMIVRFCIPAGIGLIFGISLPLAMRTSVTAGVLFAALFLVWPAVLYFDMVVNEELVAYKGVFFIFYGMYLIFFPVAAYGGFSLGVLLSPLMPKFTLAPRETVNISIGRHILLPAAIAVSGNLIASTVLRDFALRVLGAK